MHKQQVCMGRSKLVDLAPASRCVSVDQLEVDLTKALNIDTRNIAIIRGGRRNIMSMFVAGNGLSSQTLVHYSDSDG